MNSYKLIYNYIEQQILNGKINDPFLINFFYEKYKNTNFEKKLDSQNNYPKDWDEDSYYSDDSDNSYGCYSIDYYNDDDLIKYKEKNKEKNMTKEEFDYFNKYNDIYIHYNCNGYCKYDCRNLIFICGKTYPVQFNKYGKITQYSKCGHVAYKEHEYKHECKGSDEIRFNSKYANDFY
jgi:hypothetical protein